MSFNRLNSDACQYKQSLFESVGPGHYQLGTPPICDPCMPVTPKIRLQRSGVLYQEAPLVDNESELFNIVHPKTKCPTKMYYPTKCRNGTAFGYGDCFNESDETRNSNPASNLRGTGWNRWEILCKNPQDQALVPFDYNISNRIIVKDNHRPCIPRPLDVRPSLPHPVNMGTCERTQPVCANPTEPVSIQWQTCQNLSDMV